MNATKTVLAAAAAAVLFGMGSAEAQSVTGAGSTFIYPALSQWADAYKKDTGVEVNYQAIGSGGGLQQLAARTVTFAASDKPLQADDLESKGYVQWPVIMGGIVPVVNLKGVEADDLVLDGKTLADIYLGKVKTWNDKEIQALNPEMKLPDTAITVVHRSDGSGTTFNFTDYLNKVSPEWKSKVGSSTEVNWPTGIGGKGNQGVAQYVSTVRGAVGYVEYAFALQGKLAWTRLKNQSGNAVSPNLDSFKAAAKNADYTKVPGYALILTNQPGKDTWPILASTFVLMYEQPQDPKAATEALKFFDWVFKNGDAAAEKLEYISIPQSLAPTFEKDWAHVKSDGKALWPAS